MFLQMPPPAPPAAAVVAFDPSSRTAGYPLYRAPWEPQVTPKIPEKIAFVPPPLTKAPFRMATQRRYWLGPVPDFFLSLGFVALGGGVRDPRSADWVLGGDPAANPAPPVGPAPAPARWEHPPLRLEVH